MIISWLLLVIRFSFGCSVLLFEMCCCSGSVLFLGWCLYLLLLIVWVWLWWKVVSSGLFVVVFSSMWFCLGLMLMVLVGMFVLWF